MLGKCVISGFFDKIFKKAREVKFGPAPENELSFAFLSGLLRVVPW